MKQVVIRTGGKQYLVKEGQTLVIEKLPQEAGDKFKFEEVLAVIDGDATVIGQPLVKDAVVEAEVIAQSRAKKVRIETFANKTRRHRTAGHRQSQTEVKIKSLPA